MNAFKIKPKSALDLDTMYNVVNNDPGHIARAKAKAERIKRELNAKTEHDAKVAAKRVVQKNQNARESVVTELKAIAIGVFLTGTLWGYICHAMMF